MRWARAASICGAVVVLGRRRFLLRAILLQAVAQLQASLQRLERAELRQQRSQQHREMCAMVHDQQ